MVVKRGSKGSKQKRGGGELGGDSNYIPLAGGSSARPLSRAHSGSASVPAPGSLGRTTTTRSRQASKADVVMFWFVVVIIVGGLIALVWWSVKYEIKRRHALEKVLDPNAKTTEEERHLAADAIMYPSGGYGYGYGYRHHGLYGRHGLYY